MIPYPPFPRQWKENLDLSATHSAKVSNETQLNRGDSSILDRTSMVTSNKAVGKLVPMMRISEYSNGTRVRTREYLLVKEWQQLSQARGLSPVTHKVTGNSKHAHQCNASTLHATVSILRQSKVKSSTGIGVGVDFITLVNERESQECGA